MTLALVPTLLALCAVAAPHDTKGTSAPEDKAETVWEYLVLKYDANEDGRVSQKEYTRGAEHWKRLDKDEDGFLDSKEFAKASGRGGRRGAGGRAGAAGPKAVAPKVGAKAPDFELVVLPKKDAKSGDEKKAKKAAKAELVKLSSFQGKKPVALIFGSYT